MVAVDVSASSGSERAGKPRSLAWDEMTDTTCDDCGSECQSPSQPRRRRRGRGKRREINETPSTPKAATAAAGSEPQSILELFGLTPKASERRAKHCSSPLRIAQGDGLLTPPAARHPCPLQGHMVCSPPATNELWSSAGECGVWIGAQPVPQTPGAYWSCVPGSQQRMHTAFGTSPLRPPEEKRIAADASSRWQTETSDVTTWCGRIPGASPMSPKEQEALLQNLMPDAYEE